MRLLFLLALMFIITSCEPKENCDLAYYPSPPYGNPDYTDQFAPDGVTYVYVCYSGSYNRVVTYQVVGTCWEMYSEEDYNLNCN